MNKCYHEIKGNNIERESALEWVPFFILFSGFFLSFFWRERWVAASQSMGLLSATTPSHRKNFCPTHWYNATIRSILQGQNAIARLQKPQITVQSIPFRPDSSGLLIPHMFFLTLYLWKQIQFMK